MKIFLSPPNRTSFSPNALSNLPDGSQLSGADDTTDRINWRHYQGPRQDAVYSPIPPFDPDALVGKSEAFQQVRDLLDTATQNTLNLLIQGESGTGKNLLAQTLHARSERSENWLLIINCELTEAEDLKPLLMGVSSGEATFEGVFEIAAGGTVVFDHVDALDSEAQAHLNHILETHTFERIDENHSPSLWVRLISIASEPLSRDTFQPDLYHKLAQFPIRVPPLRERSGDVVRLAHYFLRRRSTQKRTEHELSLSEEAKNALKAHSWPGNVRELRNVMDRAVASASSSEISAEDLMLSIYPPANPDATADGPDRNDESRQPDERSKKEPSREALPGMSDEEEQIPTIETMKKEAVKRAYELCDGNVDQAAVELGIGRSTMYRMLKRYDIK